MAETKMSEAESIVPATVQLRAGVARRDITPPVGIYARSWGAARHDAAEGIHRPMTATVLALRGGDVDQPLILAVIDAGWWQLATDEWHVRGALIEALGVPVPNVIISCTHTHAGPSLSLADTDKPGGHLIRPYLDRMRDALIEASREAIARCAPAVLTWANGRCDLATNRDLPEPDECGTGVSPVDTQAGRPCHKRIVCGFNPAVTADDTLLIGRICEPTGCVMATIVNYACHPTTLAWDNRLISPDYVGAMREIIERDTGEAPCLFLQGASGELSPREQYVGDPAIADANGRRLGYAALATLQAMLPPKQMLKYAGVVESGAPLATWKRASFAPSSAISAEAVKVPLPLKKLPSIDELSREMEACTDRTMAERIRRKIRIIRDVGNGPNCEIPVWFWKLGPSFIVAQMNEAYSHFQLALRGMFPDYAVAVVNLANGACGYLSPPELHDLDIYQVWQSPFDRQALPVLLEACGRQIARMIQND